MKDIRERIILSSMSLMFPLIIILFMPSLAGISLRFNDVKKFDTIDEAVQWQKDISVIADKYETDSVEFNISINSPPTASYSVTLKPLGSGYFPEKREFNGVSTPDSAFHGFIAVMIIDGGFALLLMGVCLWCIWEPDKKDKIT